MEASLEQSSYPKEISSAIVEVTGKVKRLGMNERNEHGRYGYVSVDKFYENIGPLMAEAGIFLMVSETSSDIREHNSKNGPVAWLYTKYELQFVHETGVVGAPVTRSCALPISGPQAFGAAQSYIEKQFLRQVFKIPTGEKDADEMAQDASPISAIITTSQALELTDLMDKAGLDEAGTAKFLKLADAESVQHIPAAKLVNARAYLNERIKQRETHIGEQKHA